MTTETFVQSEPAVGTGDEETLAQYAARIGLRASWIAGIVSALLVLVLNLNRNPIPMLEDARSFGAIGLFFIVAMAFAASLTAFYLGIKAWNLRTPVERQRSWKVAILPVAIAYTLLTGLIAAIVLQLAEPAFPGLALDRFQAAFVVGLASAMLITWLVSEVMIVSSSSLLRLTIIVVAAGVYLATSNADDPFWWTISFSSLGTHGTFVSWIFNTTLIFAGLMILVWIPYFMVDLDVLKRHGLTTESGAKWTRRGLIALGITIGMVGLFENGVHPLQDFIHNTTAPLMGVVVIMLAFGVRRLIPGLSREAYATSYFLGATLLAGVVFVLTGYFNTAGMTIYGAAIAFTWMALFVGAVEQEANELEPPPA